MYLSTNSLLYPVLKKYGINCVDLGKYCHTPSPKLNDSVRFHFNNDVRSTKPEFSLRFSIFEIVTLFSSKKKASICQESWQKESLFHWRWQVIMLRNNNWFTGRSWNSVYHKQTSTDEDTGSNVPNFFRLVLGFSPILPKRWGEGLSSSSWVLRLFNLIL